MATNLALPEAFARRAADEHWARGEAEGRRRARLDTLALEARKGQLPSDLNDLAEKLSSNPARRRQVDLVRLWIEDAEAAEELSDFTVQVTDDESPPQQAPLGSCRLRGTGPQTITFTAPASGIVGGSALLDPSASSGFPVSLSVDPSTTYPTLRSCSLSGDTVNYLHSGNCVIDANQAGNVDYQAAPKSSKRSASARRRGGTGKRRRPLVRPGLDRQRTGVDHDQRHRLGSAMVLPRTPGGRDRPGRHHHVLRLPGT